MLSLNIKERSALYAAYMPHLNRLGDEVFLLLSLLDDPNRIPVAGQVVWVTPANTQNNKTQGVGVHFSDDESGQLARRRIEAVLGALLQSTRQTHTY